MSDKKFTEEEIIKANNILDKLDFFSQRAGRELWNEKPVEIQDADIRNREEDIKFLKALINRQQYADVAEVIHSDWHTSTVRMSSIDVTCRNCHRTEKISITNYFEYCPHCGAKMDGERKDA